MLPFAGRGVGLKYALVVRMPVRCTKPASALKLSCTSR